MAGCVSLLDPTLLSHDKPRPLCWGRKTKGSLMGEGEGGLGTRHLGKEYRRDAGSMTSEIYAGNPRWTTPLNSR